MTPILDQRSMGQTYALTAAKLSSIGWRWHANRYGIAQPAFP